ncbi:MAG: hypothetical protein OEL53_02835 [Rhodospirillales bacterium]|nr:hypothetical protein [Rhodospirillales bacterium]
MNLRVLKAITVGMGFLIVGGLVVLGFGAMEQAGRLKTDKPAPVGAEAAKPFGKLELGEPAGTEIHGVATGDRKLYLHLRGGGPDRVLVLDGQSLAVLGTIVPTAPSPAPAQ